MINLQGLSPINASYFAAVIGQINAIKNQISFYTNGGFTNALIANIEGVVNGAEQDMQQQLLAIIAQNSSLQVAEEINFLFINGAKPTFEQVMGVLINNALEFPEELITEMQMKLQKLLQDITNRVMQAMIGEINVISRQIAALVPINALATLPVTDLASAITWINSFKAATIVQQAAAYAVLIAQLSAMQSQQSSIQSSIQSAATALGGGVVMPGAPSIVQPQRITVNMTVTRA